MLRAICIHLLVCAWTVTLGQEKFPDPKVGLIPIDDPTDPLRGGTNYFIGSFKANSFDADNYCRESGASLLSIETEAEQNRVVRKLVSSGFGGRYYWTSGSDFIEEGKLIWTSTGQPMLYRNFMVGQINTQDKDCVIVGGDPLWNYTWGYVECHREYDFICEQ